MSSQELEACFQMELDFLRRAQLNAYLRLLPEEHQNRRQLTPLILICCDGSQLPHSLSHFYTLLKKKQFDMDHLTFIRQWESDLQVTFSQLQKD